MRIAGFVWLGDIFDDSRGKPGVTRREAEEVLLGWPTYRLVETGRHPGEAVYAALGETERGRHLVVFFMAGPRTMGLVLRAREMTSVEKRRYAGK